MLLTWTLLRTLVRRESRFAWQLRRDVSRILLSRALHAYHAGFLLLLAAEHVAIGLGEQFFGTSSVSGIKGCAEAAVQDILSPADLTTGGAHSFAELGDARADFFLGDVGYHQDEFVTAHARDEIGAPAGGSKSIRDFNQDLITGRVAKGVVDLLEPVEVANQHGAIRLRRAQALE